MELLDLVEDGLCLSEPGLSITYANPAAARLLGWPGRTPPGTVCEAVCGRAFGRRAAAWIADCPLRKGSPAPACEGVSREGSPFLRVRCMFLAGDPERRRLTMIQDVSSEIERQRRNEDWRSMAAHDLRAPLSNLHGVVSAISEIPPGQPLGPTESRLLDLAVRAGRRMSAMLDLYLDVARLDAGALAPRIEPVRVAEVLRACVDEETPVAESRGVALCCGVNDELLSARADRELLARVVDNLISNALKFTPDGGRVVVTAAQEGDRAVLRVRDSGPGIPPQDAARIFDRYFQAEAHRRGAMRGVGLGLTFCREAVDAMGGTIEAGAAAPGAEFVVRLPLA